MIHSDDEQERRLGAVRAMMRELGLDALVAEARPGDVPGHGRYLSLYSPDVESSVAIVVVPEDGAVLVTNPVQAGFVAQMSWFAEPVLATTPIAEFLGHHLSQLGVRTIGIADAGSLPTSWTNGILAANPNSELVDVGDPLLQLRMIKGPEELGLIRQSCDVADEVWRALPEIMKVGRAEFEILADIECMLRSRGCEGSFNLILSLPMFSTDVDRQPAIRRLRADDWLILEISPRIGGYYSQLTGVVTIGKASTELRAIYDAVIAARERAQPLLTPGADFHDVAQATAADLRSHGIEMGPSIGHLCGVELVEPRVGAASLPVREGMTLIFHPPVKHPQLSGIMRADTYEITHRGAERLNTYDVALLELS